MTWPTLAEHPKVSDIPPGTFWAKNVKDQWVIQLRRTGEEIAASASLRTAIARAREVLDRSIGPNAELSGPQRPARKDEDGTE